IWRPADRPVAARGTVLRTAATRLGRGAGARTGQADARPPSAGEMAVGDGLRNLDGNPERRDHAEGTLRRARRPALPRLHQLDRHGADRSARSLSGFVCQWQGAGRVSRVVDGVLPSRSPTPTGPPAALSRSRLQRGKRRRAVHAFIESAFGASGGIEVLRFAAAVYRTRRTVGLAAPQTARTGVPHPRPGRAGIARGDHARATGVREFAEDRRRTRRRRFSPQLPERISALPELDSNLSHG